ncbi:MAG: Cna B-type domain-containing protein [Clostridia bacterium]|nr:Cna B-type domain-containing protein [Clostridia bacterium]
MKKTLARIFLLLCMMLVCMAAWAQSASAIVLSPFNHNTTNNGNRPTFYKGMQLKAGNSYNVERISADVSVGTKITLPGQTNLSSFSFGGVDCSLTNLDHAPQDWVLVGWLDVTTETYYSLAGKDSVDITVKDANSVYYADWQPATYDFRPADSTQTLVDTVDTSSFIDINVFDYNELFNIYSTTFTPGTNNDTWNNQDNRNNGYLGFNDYATYNGQGGSIGRPNNIDGTSNGYTQSNTNPGIMGSGNTLNQNLIDVMFSTADNYVGKNYLGKGNYLFSYDATTGMYSFNSKANGAIYQQSEQRFYVHNAPSKYRNGNYFFPLNYHTNEPNANVSSSSEGYTQYGGNANYWFGMSFGVDFFLPDNSGSGGNKINDQHMIYEFTGDDDMWVVIDGKVVLDIGGIHDPIDGSINFSTGEVTVKGRGTQTYKFEAGNHRMQIYYLERGGDLSNCDMKFNLLPKYEAAEVGLDVVSVNKIWDTDEGIKKPNDITVELLKDGTVVNSATLAESNNWHHTFGNLTKGSYSVREADSNLFYEVITESKTETIANCWVFTDAANLKDNPKIWIGCDHGSVLSSVDCSSVNVQNMNADANVIIEMTGNSAQDNAMSWTVEMASNAGGQHFYLKNANGQYLDISGQIRTVSNKSDASLLYINASGDLQDADSTHRLVHTDSGFGTSDKKPGNETNLSNNRVSVYRQTTQETAVYTYKLTNKFVNPAIQLLKTDDSGNHLPGATLKLTGPDGYAVEWESGNTAERFPVTQAEYYKQEPWLKLSEGDKKYVYTFTETRAPQGYQKSDEQLKFYVRLDDEGRLCVVDTNDDKVISEYIYDKDRQTWTLVSGTAHLTLFNSCATGNLQISKTIVSDTIDTTKEFPFTVTFANSTHALAKTYIYKIGDQAYELELTNGKGTLYLKHGQTALFEGLPIGTTYTIKENVPTGYTVSPESASGSIEENKTSTAAFTNKQTPGSLEISKTIEGGPSGKTFDFIVELSHDDISLTADHRTYTIDGTEYTLGADNKITLGHGQKAVFSNLPVGTEYKVTEVQDNGYIQVAPPKDHPTAEGTVTEGSLVQTAPFVNTEISLIPALVVRKTVAGNASDTSDTFEFVLAFKDASGAAITKDLRFAYSDDAAEAGFRVAEYNTEKGGYVFNLKHKQAVTFVSLTQGWTYEVVEQANSKDYVCTSGPRQTGTVPKESDEVLFHNEKNTLTLVKTVSGLEAADAQGYAPSVVIKNTDEETVYEGMLTPETIQNLILASGSYTLEESGCNMSAAGYDWTSATLTGSGLTTAASTKDNDKASFTFTIPANTSAAMALTLNNVYAVKTNDLSITKTVVGDEAAQTAIFDFTVTLSNDKHALNEAGYTYTVKNADGEDTLTSTLALTKGSDGKYTGTIQLKHDETATIENLPIDTVYTITEADKSGFTLTTKAGDTGTIANENDTYAAAFTNARDFIQVRKVALDQNGEPLAVTVEALFTANNGGAITNTQLVAGADYTTVYITKGAYTVGENNYGIDGYVRTSVKLTDEEDNELDMNSANLVSGGKYTLTNTYAQGSLELTKTVSNNPVPDYEFEFTIDLKFKNAALSGDYLDYEITHADKSKTTGTLTSSKVRLKHGDSLVFPTLPIGTTYTITETKDGKYLQTTPEGEAPAAGSIANTERVKVDFVNKSFYPTLSVEKTVTGNAAKLTDAFRFLVVLKDGNTVITEALSYTLDADPVTGTKQTLTYDAAAGGYVLNLTGGQKATLVSLTPGWTYSVEELDANTDNYTLVSKTDDHNGLLPQTAANVSFINSRNAVNIEKKAIGLSGSDTVSPEFSVDGTSIGKLTSGGEAYKLYVTPGQSYAVTETGTDVEGYVFLSAEISATDNLAVSNTDGMGFTFPADGMAAIPTVTVTNKYDPVRAGLSISKTVVGDEDAKKQAFTFTVKLTNDKHTLADKYSYTVNGGDAQDLLLTDGVGTITLTDGQTATLTGLPLGTAYEVTETPVDGFTAAPNEAVTGTILNTTDAYRAAFTNTRTAIKVKKVTEGLADSDVPAKITAAFTGSQSASVELAPNAADFTSLYLTPGTYAVTESSHEVACYELVSSVLTDKEGKELDMTAAALVNGGEYTITNTYKQGSMTLSKSVTNSTGDPEFLFDIVFSLNGEALDERYQVYTLNGVDGAFTGSRLQVTLGDLDSIVFPLLPIGAAYTITETPDTGYQQVSPQGGQSASGVIGENSDDHTVTFVNTEVSLIPALVVEKTVSGNASSTSDEFDFVVRFWTDETKTTPVTQDLRYAFSTTPATDGFSAISYDETAGGYPITLRHGQLATFVSLTQGWAYEVWENDNALGYTLVSANPASGVMPEVSASASFHNVKNELTLVKKVSGLDEGDSVSPSVEITDKAGKTVFSGVLTPDKIETLSLIPGDYTLTESGCDMTGKGYDWTSATLSGLNAEIASKDGGKAAFTFTVPENASGAMALQLDNVYAVKRGGLVIRKTLENAGDDATAFTFTLTLSNDSHPLDAAGYPCTIYNADGAVSGTQRVAAGSTIMLSHGQYAMIENLPVSTQYAVAESAQSGYTLVSKEGESGVIADTESSYTAAFVNRRTAIRIQKTVSGENADALTTPVTVTFTKVGETQPAATVTLTPGAGYTDVDLPEGMYTVTESGHSVAGYLCQTTFTVDGSGSAQAMTGNEAAVSIGSVQVADGASYTIDNSYADGELALSKKIIGGTDGKRFTFTVEFSHDSVTLTDKHLTYTLNGQTLVLPADGKLTLGHGETAVFPNLPIGTAYTITETQDSGYQQVSPSGGQAATGTITGSESVQAAFVNTAVALIPAIVVEKTVGGNAADTQDAFDFVVRFSDGGETVTQDLRYALSTDAPEDGFRTLRYDADKGGYPVTLRHGEKATIVSLTEGWTYAVIEDEAAAAAKGYVLASSENAKGTVPEISETASFINERNLVKIRKVTDGLPAGTTVSPTITVGGKTIGTLTSDTEETLSVYVARGESYALTESGFDAAGFDFSGASISATDGLEVTGADGSFTFAFPAGGLDVVPTVTLTNAYTSDLIIEKQIEHGADSGEAIFPIRISLSHAEKTLADAYPYTTSKGTSGMLVLDGGSGEIGLTGGETATLTGLPYGTVFSLTEGVTEGFAQVSAQGTDGSIAAKGQQKAVFVNKPIDRSLSITKKLAGNAADSADSFTFTVMLTGADGSALAGSYPVSIAGTASGSIASGGTITLTGGQTAIIADLPDGTVFTVTESDPTAKHYVLSLGDEANSDETATADGLGLTGSIRREDEDVVFTNERNAVRIRKIASGLLGTDTVSPTVSVDGEAIGQLVSGGDSALVYLVPGTHALAESGYEMEGYDFIASSVTGSAGVQAEKTGDAFSFTLESGLTTIPQVTIHNEYAVKSDSLSIRKEIAGNAASADDVFTFDITLTRGGQSVTGSFTMQILQGEAAVRTVELFADAGGKATLTLTGGQKAIITGLPLGTVYTVTEQPAEGYVLSSAEGAQGTIDGEAACEASFLNTKDVFSTLTVIKTIVGSSPSTSDSFTFTVTLTDPDGKPVSGEFACAGLNVPSLDFDRKGEARFTLSHGQSVVISGLPFGTAYTVEEKEHRDYEMTHSTGASGVIDADGETSSFQNTHAGDLPSLTLSKAVEGNAAIAEDSFSFTITMTDKDGKPLTGTWTCSLMTASGAVNGVLQLDENGSAVIGLKADESFTIMKLPVGASYTVTETIDPALGYTASQPSFSGVIENQSTNASAPFVNTKHTALTIRKTASSSPALTAYPAPTVSLFKADSSGNKTGDALATVQLEANGEAGALDAKLETGALYLIEESGHTVEDYDVQAALIVNGTPANGMTFTAQGGEQSIALVLDNVYTSLVGPLTITKTVRSAEGENAAFEFTVELQDAQGNVLEGSYPYEGTLDGTQAISGAIASGGSITLMGGGSVTIGRLPLGTVYTVTEREDAAYKPESGTASGTIDIDGETAAFVNAYYDILPALKVEKRVQGNASSTEDTFRFTVTLTDKTSGEALTGQISMLDKHGEAATVALDENGSVSFELAHGESVTFIKLPVNTAYTVAEERGSYVLVSSENAQGAIIGEQDFASTLFINERNAEAAIAKAASGIASGEYPAPTVSIYREGDMSTPVWTGTLEANSAAAQIGPMAQGSYVLVESGAAVDGYSCAAALSVNGETLTGDPASGVPFTVKESETALTLLVTNVYEALDVTFSIAKIASGLPETLTYPAPTVSIYAAQDMTAPVLTLELAPNGDAQTLSLAPGDYVLREQGQTVADYSCASVLYVNGTVSIDNTFTITPAMTELALVVENTYAAEFALLTLSKTVTGEGAAYGDDFTFIVTLTDAEGNTLEGSYPYEGTLDGAQEIRGTVASGSAVTLRHGGSITVKLPLDARYAITEALTEGYILVSSEGSEGVITPANASAAFVNRREFSVTVRKQWFGDKPENRPKSVRIQLLLDGKPYGDPVTLNEACGWAHTFTGLEVSGPYAVEELSIPKGYVCRIEETEENSFLISNLIISIPQTGDTSASPMLYAAMLAVSGALLALLLRKKRA